MLRRDRPDEADLIPEGDFIALLAALRQIRAIKEPSNLGRVANIVHLVGTEEIRSTVALVREDWKAVGMRPVFLDLQGEHFQPSDVVDDWINGEEFHQDAALVERIAKLKAAGPLAAVILQVTVRDLCLPALTLDNLVALVLGEPLRPLPGASSAAGSGGDAR